MKKLLGIVAAIVMMVQSASATISVIWQSGFGIDDPTIGVSEPDLVVGSLVQLIWTPDAIIGMVDALNPTVAQGNDIVIDSLFTSLLGGFGTSGTYADGVGALSAINESTLLTGYVYLRVFNAAAPTIGSWYGESTLIGNNLTDQDPSPATPDVLDIAGSSMYTLTTEIVPEPSVLAFLGIGAALVAVRRMRRS